MRLLYALALVVLATAVAAAPRELTERERLEDFDTFWTVIDRGYPYLAATPGAWRKVREQWRPRAAQARSRDEFVAALDGAIGQLRDDHVTLSERAPGSLRRVPAETDIWAHWRDDVAVIEAVRTYGEADVAGLRPGQVVRSIGGIAAPVAVRDLSGGSSATPAERDWALRHALAGPRDGVLQLEVAESRGLRAYEVARNTRAAPNAAPIVARRIGERRDLGYMRLKAPLTERALAAQIDGALNYLADTRGLILDLREATGPYDNPGVARETTIAILRRFAPRAAAWQVRESRTGERVTDSIDAGVKPYTAPLVVLVDRWTAGEGEALAAGLAAVAKARLVGTRMAGLRGELGETRLPRSGIVLRHPAQKVFTVEGSPRESIRPDVFVDLAAPQGGPGDPVLYQGLRLLEK